MSETGITTVIPAHNAAAYLDACLQSVLAQRGPFRHEVIVVDDASSDATAAIARRCAGVRLLQTGVNSGPSAARNLGIAAARHELIAFLDADDLWPPGRLAAGLDVLATHPEIGLVFGDCSVFAADEVLLPSFFQDSGFDDRFWGDPLRVVDQDLKLFRLNYIPTGAALVRRAHLQTVGGFDASRRLVEDLDLWLRLAKVCPFAHIPTICQHKRSHDANVSRQREAMTLANLEVLGHCWQAERVALRRRGLRMRRYFAHEHCLLGDLREQAGDAAGARRWYLQALRTAPSLRAVYYWLRSWAPGRAASAARGSGA